MDLSRMTFLWFVNVLWPSRAVTVDGEPVVLFKYRTWIGRGHSMGMERNLTADDGS